MADVMNRAFSAVRYVPQDRACPNGLESRNHLGLRVKMSEA